MDIPNNNKPDENAEEMISFMAASEDCLFSRSKFGEYPEYHTSFDNLNIISNKSLNESLEVLVSIVDFAELSFFPKLITFCEPNLSADFGLLDIK